jgi:AcrR family transcriptional regulator
MTEIRSKFRGRRPKMCPLSLRSGIIEAAGELFGIHGFNSTTVEAIAQRAGTHKMTVYRMFESKEGLGIAYLELLVERAEVFWSDLQKRFPSTPRMLIREFFNVVRETVANSSYRGDPCMRLAIEVDSVSEEFCRMTARYRIDQWSRFEKIAVDAVPERSRHFANLMYLVWVGFVSPGIAAPERAILTLSLLEIVDAAMAAP